VEVSTIVSRSEFLPNLTITDLWDEDGAVCYQQLRCLEMGLGIAAVINTTTDGIIRKPFRFVATSCLA
jgi:hypothetical protein